MPAKSSIHRVFVTNLRNRREELGLTQMQVARALDWKQPAYARLESGEHRVYLETVDSVASVLSTTVTELLTVGRFKATKKKISA